MLRSLKPIKGWRAFAGEVGVIVLGVLLALGAQQAVEAWQVRKDVRAFRETIDREIAYTLYTQDVRYVQIDCDLRRLGQVRQWLERSRSGQDMEPIYPRAGEGIAAYRGAWNSRDAETYRQLPAEVRQQYALFYDGDDNLQSSRLEELVQWRSLNRFAEPGPVSLDERRDANMPLTSLQRRIELARGNIDAERQIARDLGIRSMRPPDIDEGTMRSARKCRSIAMPPQP